MRERRRVICAAAALVLLTAAGVRAQCVPTARAVSQLFSFPNFVAGPIASNGSLLAVAKTDSTSGTPAINVAIYDHNLNQIGPDHQIVSTTLNGAVALLWTGNEFALFYQSPTLPLMLQRIDTSGNPIGAAIPIVNHPWSPADEVDVVWVPARNGLAIARTVTGPSDRGLWITVVSPTGAVLSDTNISLFLGSPARPRAFALPDGSVGTLWLRTGNPPPLAIALVSPAGVFRAGTVSERTVIAARVAADNSSILVIFSSTVTGGTELRYAQFRNDLTAIKSDSSFLTARGVEILPLQLMFNAALSEWVLTYVDDVVGQGSFAAETRLRRFQSPSGAPSDSLLSPDPVLRNLTAPYPIVFANGAYIASIQRVRSRTEGSESYLVKICPFFVTASVDHPIWRPFVPLTFTATPSGGAPDFSYEWQFGDNDSARGAVVQHAYSAAGTYTVTLTGTDATGATAISRVTVQITTAARQRAVRH